MHKLVLFTSKEGWGNPSNLNLQGSFAESGRHFGSEHLVLFAAPSGKGAVPELATSASIAIAWEPPLGRSYRQAQIAKIRDHLRPFLDTATFCSLVLHQNTEETKWDHQRRLIRDLRCDTFWSEEKYSHGPPPYTLFCYAILAAGDPASTFENHLNSLVIYLLRDARPQQTPNPVNELAQRLGKESGWLHLLVGAKAALTPLKRGLAKTQPDSARLEQYEILKEHRVDLVQRRMNMLTELRSYPAAQSDAGIRARLDKIATDLENANATWISMKDVVIRGFTSERANQVYDKLHDLFRILNAIEVETFDAILYLQNISGQEQ
jgi:hypothetical protein